MSKEIVTFKNISKDFRKITAVRDISFSINCGEFFSLLGPSGCGKTTLLRLVAGLETPSNGELYIDNQLMNSITPNKRPVNIVLQSYAIFPHLNVRDNIAFGMRKSNLNKSELNERIKSILAMINLSGFENRKPQELSGGQRQRVALARALIKEPKVLLLDEPLGALDKKLRSKMQLELRALQKNLNTTFMFVTHDQEEALALSDRVAVMNEGSVVEIATPYELYNNPKTFFTADFIGHTNFFEGEILSMDDDCILVESSILGDIKLKNNFRSFQPRDKIWVAMRPEDLQASLTEPDSTDNYVEGFVGASSYLGDRHHILIKTRDNVKPILLAISSANDSDMELHVDRKIWVLWKNDSLNILPR